MNLSSTSRLRLILKNKLLQVKIITSLIKIYDIQIKDGTFNHINEISIDERESDNDILFPFSRTYVFFLAKRE